MAAAAQLVHAFVGVHCGDCVVRIQVCVLGNVVVENNDFLLKV